MIDTLLERANSKKTFKFIVGFDPNADDLFLDNSVDSRFIKNLINFSGSTIAEVIDSLNNCNKIKNGWATAKTSLDIFQIPKRQFTLVSNETNTKIFVTPVKDL